MREFRMRMRRAQHQRVQRRLWRMVVGIAALAANQRVVFLAENALTDAEFDGSCHRISNCRLHAGASSNRHPPHLFCLSMALSENRYPLFRVML